MSYFEKLPVPSAFQRIDFVPFATGRTEVYPVFSRNWGRNRFEVCNVFHFLETSLTFQLTFLRIGPYTKLTSASPS